MNQKPSQWFSVFPKDHFSTNCSIFFLHYKSSLLCMRHHVITWMLIFTSSWNRYRRQSYIVTHLTFCLMTEPLRGLNASNILALFSPQTCHGWVMLQSIYTKVHKLLRLLYHRFTSMPSYQHYHSLTFPSKTPPWLRKWCLGSSPTETHCKNLDI